VCETVMGGLIKRGSKYGSTTALRTAMICRKPSSASADSASCSSSAAR
jgi:hypothetical protein